MRIPYARFLHDACVILLVGFLARLFRESNTKFIARETYRLSQCATQNSNVLSTLNKALVRDLIEEYFETYRALTLERFNKRRIIITLLLYYNSLPRIVVADRNKQRSISSLVAHHFQQHLSGFQFCPPNPPEWFPIIAHWSIFAIYKSYCKRRSSHWFSLSLPLSLSLCLFLSVSRRINSRSWNSGAFCPTDSINFSSAPLKRDCPNRGNFCAGISIRALE